MTRATQALGPAFERALVRAGVQLTDLYRHRRDHAGLHRIAELLTDWDERLRLWRFRHYSIVARAIGEESTGIQGVPVPVLSKLITQRQLPRLWEARTRLVELFDAEHPPDGEPGG